MSLGPGSTLGPFKIHSLLGKGGMGEVFSALDTRLGRQVALKILPSDFTADTDRLRRFQSEAQTLASINHPNILVIHEVGAENGNPYLVSELLEGHTLREELNGKSLPIRKALDYALQIAHGLAAAHARGIVHRDLKPENIFITKDGRVKILDFGLAKLNSRSQIANLKSQISPDSPTLLESTVPGLILGTPGYMSPEQVRGEPVDHRSDIFAFGCVLYEMLSGRTPFRKGSSIQTMNAILNEDPAELRPGDSKISLSFERVVLRCLNKDPNERFQSAKDLQFALETPTSAQIDARFVAPSSKAATLWKWASTVLALTLIGVTTWFASRPQSPPTPVRATWLDISPPQTRFAFHAAPSVSPDGHQIAFYAPAPDETNKVAIWVRELDSPAARPLPGTTDLDLATLGSPEWSPDSRSLAFFSMADSKLKRVDLAGGNPLTLAETPNPRGCSWGSQDVIVFIPAPNDSVHRIQASGRDESTLPLPASLTGFSSWPHFLPDGRHFLLSTETNGCLVVALDGTYSRALTKESSQVQYANGHLFFGRESSLFAQQFDLKTLTASGEPFRIAENLGFNSGDARSYAFSVSAGGTFAYWTGPFFPPTQLTWFSRAGARLSAIGSPDEYVGFAFAENVPQIVVERHEGKLNRTGLWLIDSGAGSLSRFSGSAQFRPWEDGTPVFSPARDRVYFASFPGIAVQFLQSPISQKLYEDFCWLNDISPDGHYLMADATSPQTASDLWIFSLTDKTRKPFLDSRYNEWGGRFSPDGRWVAYLSDEIGAAEVYVQSFPEPTRPIRISRSGGQIPEWRRDGKELYFLAPDGMLMAAAVEATNSSIRPPSPTALFPIRTSTDFGRRQYQPNEDGTKFLINSRVEDSATPTIRVALNWKALLPR